MRGRTGKGAVSLLAVALLGIALTATPTGADQAEDRDTYYIVDTYGHPFEPYAELPNEAQQGIPGTNVELQQAPLPIHCEAIAALYETSTLVDGVAAIIAAENGLHRYNYRNPTKAWALNPEGNLPKKSEVATFPNGPRAYAECPTDQKGIAQATFGRYLSDQFSFESTSSDTTSRNVEGEALLETETTNKVIGVKVGDLSIGSVLSWLKVDLRPGQEPKVSYRLELGGISDGKQLNGANEKGVVMSGENLGGADFIKQFNEQAKSHEEAFQVLFRYGLRILEPRFTRNQRSAADRGGSVYPYYYELSALDGKLQPSARRDQTGHGFGFRMGVSRVGGSFEFFRR